MFHVRAASKSLKNPDSYEGRQINFCSFGRVNITTVNKQLVDPTVEQEARCVEEPRTKDLKRLYTLDYFFAVTSWAKAINLPHIFHLKLKKKKDKTS